MVKGIYDEVQYGTGVGDVDGDGLDDVAIGARKMMMAEQTPERCISSMAHRCLRYLSLP